MIGSIPVGTGTMVLRCFLFSMEAEGECAEVSVEWFGKWLKGWEEDEEMIQERGSRKSEWRVRSERS